ncbi:Holliday junction branch migration protein RuvA [Stenoxybacter acetivorans]|uniref:Holliday junction branch migration protein RuvA n=1 Tax=Stenoxybacter acetivorans TaxID=422441 RepID=UPI0005621794|nr:Holliday junction branch migration protein RuvA [Stenoxybacter acetivorans]
MISRLTGILIEKQPPKVLVDVQGVAYEIDVSMQTFYALPPLNERVQLHTQQIIREDAHLLFGFIERAERETFRQLIKVSGIGAKIALGILSAMNSAELAQAVANEDIKRLSAAPGIGKKTAERMILELRGKLTDFYVPNPEQATSFINQHDDIINTLLALGYTEREAQAACKGLPENIDVSEGVRQALKNMLK